MSLSPAVYHLVVISAYREHYCVSIKTTLHWRNQTPRTELGGVATMEQTQSIAGRVLDHLCGKGIYGDVTEWCEMRRDCVFVVTCPDCNQQFTLDEHEYEELVHLSAG